ncbi:PQQ-binding-like beta-propeller repeat protein [Natronococcus sp. A-GB7]|uniref:outer membrane protein assembly factor BamB family protein n=1 Tax=Natronococcus sp. A-GB7 TaxID=3037649 RepID=UPI00241DD256|nr:PQQ-binding-like beta-propeller repeat protein [Natronococcus sp. A-GB7]MDG5819069.1 PQQ-like beta-propeller repeat protein [Natronococcus sp. A-GB7]
MDRRRLLRSALGTTFTAALAGCAASLEDRFSDPGSIDGRDPTPLTDGTNAWPSEGFDAENTGYNPDAELLEVPPDATAITGEGSGIETSLGGGVAVAGDRCYFGSGGDVVCYATTGRRRWAYEADTAAGVRSVPSLAEDVAYVTSDNGTYALDAADGEELWTTDAFVRWGSPVLTEDYLYALGGSGIVALDPETGATAWEADPPNPRALAVADGTVYMTSTSDDGGAAAVADGEVVWSREDVTDCFEPPVVTDEFVLASSRDGRLTALDRVDGTTVWSHDRGTTGTTQPAVGHGRVYLPRETRSRTVCLDLESGESLWTLETDFYSDQPVAVADGVYFGTPNEGLFAVEPDGTVRWHDTELRTDGRMAAVGETLYAVSFGGPFGSGDLHALTPAEGSD